MARNVKLALAQAVSSIVWQAVRRRRDTGHHVPILLYHRVLPGLIEDENDPLYTVLPEQFEAHMALLAREGFRSLSLKEFTEIARGQRPPQERAVVLTFDDGFADTYAIAWPLAKKYGITLNLFVCTGLIGETRPLVITQNGYIPYSEAAAGTFSFSPHIRKFPQLWRPLIWRELDEMNQGGAHLGLHGHSHRNLAFLEPEELSREIATGADIFREGLGYRPVCLALPYGGHEANLSQIVGRVKTMGLDFIFTTIFGRSRLPSNDSVFPRISIYQQDTLETFRQKLLGAYDWLGPLQHLLRVAQGLRLRR